MNDKKTPFLIVGAIVLIVLAIGFIVRQAMQPTETIKTPALSPKDKAELEAEKNGKQ